MLHARRTAMPAALLMSLALALPALIGVTLATPAQAHTGLVSSTPTDGELLAELPAEVTLTFTEDLGDPAYVVVTGPDGADHGDGAPVVEGAGVTQAVLETAPAGAYTLAYRVISADGHPVSGEIGFTVENGGTASSTSKTSDAVPADADAEEGFWARRGMHVAVAAALVAAVVGGVALARRRSA